MTQLEAVGQWCSNRAKNSKRADITAAPRFYSTCNNLPGKGGCMIKIKCVSCLLVLIFALLVLNYAPLCAAVDVSGDWQGSWTSNYGGSGGLSAHITQSGTILGGHLTVSNTECGTFSNLPLSGSVAGSVMSISASAYCSSDGSYNSLSYTNGYVNGNNISGSYTVYSDGEFWDSGSFNLYRAVNTIKASAGPGGIILPSGTVSVNAGSNQTFTIKPNSGYEIMDVKVDGVSVGAQSSYAFYSISSNHTIAATFTLKPKQVMITPILSLLLGDDGPSQSPVISLSKSTVNFTATEGSGSPSVQTVSISNSGGGTLTGLEKNITYGSGQPTGWLAASLSSETAPATLSLQASTGSLSDGTYTANVALTSSGANNSPQNISVTFTVSPLPTGPTLNEPTVSGDQITLTWTFSWPGGLGSSNEAYLLEESTTSSNSGFSLTGSYYTRTSPYTVTLARSQGTYFYRVRVRTYALGLTAYSEVRTAVIAPPSGPTTLKITNNLYSGVEGTYPNQIDWGRLNTVLSLRVGPTQESVLSGNGAYELLQPSDSVNDAADTHQISPTQQQTFDVSRYGFDSEYYVLIWLGWWELFCSPPDYLFCYYTKHFSSVIDCLGKVEYGNKWAVVHVYPPFGSPEEIRTSDHFPPKSWYGTGYCQ